MFSKKHIQPEMQKPNPTFLCLMSNFKLTLPLNFENIFAQFSFTFQKCISNAFTYTVSNNIPTKKFTPN